MSRVKHFLYRLLRGRHLRHWRDFLSVPQSYIRIALYLIHHGNKATKREIIDNLKDLGGDPRSPETIERTIRYMKSDGTLKEDTLGVLSLKNPRRYLFIVKWVRGNVFDRWFVLSIPFSVLAFLLSFIDIFFCQFFIVIVIVLIVLSIVDDYIHMQSW